MLILLVFFLVLLVVLFLGSKLKVYFTLSMANFKAFVCECVSEIESVSCFAESSSSCFCGYGEMWRELGVRG